MTTQITKTEPVRLDILAAETMGRASGGALEALLAANPGLADAGPFLDASEERPRAITVPSPPETPAQTVNPWE